MEKRPSLRQDCAPLDVPVTKTKRKRERDPYCLAEDENVPGNQSFEPVNIPAKKLKPMTLQGVRVPDLIVPKSAYLSWEPPIPRSNEKCVLEAMLVCRLQLAPKKFLREWALMVNFSGMRVTSQAPRIIRTSISRRLIWKTLVFTDRTRRWYERRLDDFMSVPLQTSSYLCTR